MKKVVTIFLAISLLATTPVFAAEQESNLIQLGEGMIEQEEGYWSKELTVDEIMAQKGIQSALETFYDEFPRTKAYKIMGSKVQRIEDGEEKNEISLGLKSEEEMFSLQFDIKTEKITEYIQRVFDVPESELPKTVRATLDKIYNLSPEARNLKFYGAEMYSYNIKEKEQGKMYSLGFNENEEIIEGEYNNKEFKIKLDETGEVTYFKFENIPLPLGNLEGNTKEEKAQDLLKQLYGEEANEYKIKKVTVRKEPRRGFVVFMPTSSEKYPIVVDFNNKDELNGLEVTTRDFLEFAGLL
ncbi:hypothetical protein [Aneurinibacillus migulanus]|uniref:Uncharacterized protein n=1 Tax=Aneurinibacillus migulanus TaxID=47500 RepID=A0A0D1V5Z2_ANEMI|nr:hypothetical protein [Aneurinibacillus migulanus]KIV54784.1 hypothetical protein TS65_18130 [Aneurinibacillus migulanus]KON96631.1 hypothetical protein AF333_15265 [Aneurinibacillus migulanus]MED0896785.1 hypothetical protein [Aneurinibacillus migulanus]MED1617917.1 hypothetical protein [Aneurinibacillus migulanus]SDJ51246.1 hypothetical protein SAMN04487909_11983 [Aneurinibacillus migulanus]